jgi:hypothetical protein
MKRLYLCVMVMMMTMLCLHGAEVHSSQSPEPGDSQTQLLERAQAKWNSLSADHYLMKVSYGAFSPMSGIWEVEIVNDAVIHWRFREVQDDPRYRAFAADLTMKKIFEIAKQIKNNSKMSPLIIRTVFDAPNGIVRSVLVLKNRRYTGKVTFDRNYRYDVLDLKIIK